MINEKSDNKLKVIIAPGPSEIKEASNFNALCVLDNGKALDVSQLATLIKGSLFVVANDKVLKDPIAVGEPPSALVLI